MCTSMMGGKHQALKSWGILALRIALGVIFLYTGYQKLGPGHAGAAAMMGGIFGEGAGSAVAYFVGLLEFAGGAMVLLGVYATYATTWLAIIMVVAMLTVHRGGPFYGYFVPLLALGGLLSLMGTGAGKFRLVKNQCHCPECKGDGGLNSGGCCGGCGPEEKHEMGGGMGKM